jgi:hypothetical protein
MTAPVSQGAATDLAQMSQSPASFVRWIFVRSRRIGVYRRRPRKAGGVKSRNRKGRGPQGLLRLHRDQKLKGGIGNQRFSQP